MRIDREGRALPWEQSPANREFWDSNRGVIDEASSSLPRFALRGEIALAFARYEDAFHNFLKQLRERRHPGWSEEAKRTHLEALHYALIAQPHIRRKGIQNVHRILLQRLVDLTRSSELGGTDEEQAQRRAALRTGHLGALRRLSTEHLEEQRLEALRRYRGSELSMASLRGEDLPALTPEQVREARAEGARWLAGEVELLTSGSWWEPEKWHPLAQSVAYRLIREHSRLSSLLLFGIGYFHKEAYFESEEYLRSTLEEDFPTN